MELPSLRQVPLVVGLFEEIKAVSQKCVYAEEEQQHTFQQLFLN